MSELVHVERGERFGRVRDALLARELDPWAASDQLLAPE